MWDGVDRRIFPRAEYPCLITISNNTTAPLSILTHTENISVGGVRVIIPQKIEPLTEVDLKIDLMDTLPTVISKGTISWAKDAPALSAVKPKRYDVGIQFITLEDIFRKRIQRIVDRLLRRSP